MGAEPYEYTVPYEADIQSALGKLREEVFQSGKYYGAEFHPSNAEEALELAEESGTCSILDISTIADDPDFFCAAPFTTEELTEYFGTTQPTLAQVQECDLFWDDLERGQARYVVAYDGDEPTHLHFVGYSFD